jgi:hypothetical protein
MGLTYLDLDETTRRYMLEELSLDIKENLVNYSSYFNEAGKTIWLEKFSEAIQKYDDDWLALQLKQNGCFLDKKSFTTKSGRISSRSVPYTAAETFAEGEFNRLYMRAICSQALKGAGKVVVYRGKSVDNPRQDSESKIGNEISANELLVDLRTSPGRGTRLGIGEANSGLSVKLIR